MAKKTTDTKVQDDLGSFVKWVNEQSDAYKIGLAKDLIRAKLLKGKPSATIDINYYNALSEWHKAYKQQVALDNQLGSKKPKGRYDVLVDIINNPQGSGSGSGPKTTTQKYITSASQTAKFLQPIAQDLIGRDFNKAELAKYTQLINEWQKANPTTTTTGDGYQNTIGGVDEEQMITEQVAQTGEARTKRATDAYAMMLQELGGLQ